LVRDDLLAAPDSSQVSYAALGALYTEPLPPNDPLWRHPRVTVMPHVARRPTVRQLGTEIAAKIKSIEAGGNLLQAVDRTFGY
jgi:phosphoglycerate dehydrogenase-like enzyme